MANRSTQNSSITSAKKPSKLPIFRTVVPRNSIIGSPVVPNAKLVSQNEPMKSKPATVTGNKNADLVLPNETANKAIERKCVQPIPQKSFLPVRSSNNNTCNIRAQGRPQISYMQQRTRSQVIPNHALRQPSTSPTKILKPGQGPLQPKLSRQRTFEGDSSDITKQVSPSKQRSNEPVIKSLPQPTGNSVLSTCEGSKISSYTLPASLQSKIKNDTNRSGNSVTQNTTCGIKTDLIADESYFPQEGKMNNNYCTTQESNAQEKLPKSAGFVPKEREDSLYLTTNSSHFISPKNTSRYSYTMKTQNMLSSGMENNATAEMKNNSLEKVISSIKVNSAGIIETKSPSLMESSDSSVSDLEVIEFLNNGVRTEVPDFANYVYANLEHQKSSQMKESGITNIQTPALQSSDEMVSNTLAKLSKMYSCSESIEHLQLEIQKMSMRNNESLCWDQQIPNAALEITENEVLEEDWVMVNMPDGVTALDLPSIQKNDESTQAISGNVDVTPTHEVQDLVEPVPEATDSEQSVATIISNAICNAACRSDYGIIPNTEEYFKAMHINSVKENTATNNPNCKCTLASKVQDDEEQTAENLCINNNKKTCTTSTSFDFIHPTETTINDLNDRRCKKVETTSANNDSQRTESAHVEDIMPPRSLNHRKQKQNNSTILKSSSEALPSENSSTISLRASEGMPFAISSMSIQVARLLSQCEALQRSCEERPNTERISPTLDFQGGEKDPKADELPPSGTRSQKMCKIETDEVADKNNEVEQANKRTDKSRTRTRPHTANNHSKEAPRSKQRSKSSKPAEAHPQPCASEANERSNPSSATMLMHGCGSMLSPCLSCRMKTHKDYDNTADGKKCKTVYFNPDLLPRSSKQIDGNGAPVCLRRQSSQDMLPVTSVIPGRYQIIPSTGVLESNQTVALTIASSVPIMFIKFEPDQFQVETVVSSPDVVTPNEQRLLWKETPPNQIQKALVGRLRIRNPSDSRFEVEEKDKVVDASTSYGDGILVKRVQQTRGHPQKQGVADICICTIILGILAAAIHRFSSTISEF